MDPYGSLNWSKYMMVFRAENVWSGSIEPKSEPHAEKPQAKGNELDWTSGLSRVRGLRTQELEQLQAPTPHALAPVRAAAISPQKI